MNFPNEKALKTYDRILADLPAAISEKCNGYDELYGYKILKDEPEADRQFYNEQSVGTLIYKFAKANDFHYEATMKQLISTLNWRRTFNPLKAAFVEEHDPKLNEGGIITRYPEAEPNLRVLTWNLYGKLSKHKELFKEESKFIRYRIGLMERGIQLLDFGNRENDYMTQIHDYKQVSFWSFDSSVKNSSKKIIDMFQEYYPELLYAKYFVNVPGFLAWIYDVVKLFVSEETKRKFVVLNDGTKLGKYISQVPKTYGGEADMPLAEQAVKSVKPSPYALYLLEKDIQAEID